MFYRWFTDREERRRFHAAEHDAHARRYTANLRAVHARDADDEEARQLVDTLLRRSPVFAELWAAHEVALPAESRKRVVHPTVGLLDLDCQILTAENQTERLVVFTARPGSEDAERLALLSVVGTETFATLDAVEAGRSR